MLQSEGRYDAAFLEANSGSFLISPAETALKGE